jgi:hypothetical protein
LFSFTSLFILVVTSTPTSRMCVSESKDLFSHPFSLSNMHKFWTTHMESHSLMPERKGNSSLILFSDLVCGKNKKYRVS